jgi:hypothetical protein
LLRELQMEKEAQFDLQTERITISDDRYLIYYTFTPKKDEHASERSKDATEHSKE